MSNQQKLSNIPRIALPYFASQLDRCLFIASEQAAALDNNLQPITLIGNDGNDVVFVPARKPNGNVVWTEKNDLVSALLLTYFEVSVTQPTRQQLESGKVRITTMTSTYPFVADAETGRIGYNRKVTKHYTSPDSTLLQAEQNFALEQQMAVNPQIYIAVTEGRLPY